MSSDKDGEEAEPEAHAREAEEKRSSEEDDGGGGSPMADSGVSSGNDSVESGCDNI